VRTDVAALDPDFLVFPTYKWLLGPYGRAFLYVAKRRQAEGAPLEQTSHGRRAVAADRVPYFSDLSFAPGARRFDMGERDHFVSLEMAAVGMEMMAAWGVGAVSERLRMLTDRMAEGLRGAAAGVRLPDARARAPHLLCLEFPDYGGMPEDLPGWLAAEGVHVAPRLGRLRVSPHVYNDEEDADRFVSAFRRASRR
ncbi:MAG: aminotransferase class V-fold PLP-dependent enzyme, partial [Acetobacteraceae bacterium]|nr:aminotransferase class V-fold PLP-dependent enzyme [Acetobacteraceae bacterium]